MSIFSPKKFLTLAIASLAFAGLGAATPAHAATTSSSLGLTSTHIVDMGKTRILWCS